MEGNVTEDLNDFSAEKILEYLFEAFNSGSNETEEDDECTSSIGHDLFHLYLLIPSTILTLLLAFTMRRKYTALGLLDGRPGLIFPMDIFGKSNRFSYAAAWGCIAFLTSDIIFERKYAVDLPGPLYLKAFYALLSMLIYGMDYLPLFAALSVDCVFGYIVGTLYAWLFTAVIIFQALECTLKEDHIEVVLEFIRVLPLLLCQLYLSISFPVRLVQSIRENRKFFSSMQRMTVFELEKSVHDSWEGKHIVQILRPPPSEPVPPETRKEKIMAQIKRLRKSLLYHRQTDFRYSAQLLSVMLVGSMILYKVTFEIIYHVERLYNNLDAGFISILEYIGFDEEEGESPRTTTFRDYIYVLYYILIALRGSILASVSLAALIGTIMILHMLSSYRNNLQNLYKGNTTHIPPRTGKSNPSMLIGSMKYAGYQVGYIAWGFFIQFLVYLLISVVIAVIITLIQSGFYQWILDKLMQTWPVLLIAFVLNFVQQMLAKYVFLQETGNTLRLNNRRLLFIFTYFLFFYNIFIGLISCLMRVIKSMILGSIFISRLDESVFPQRFQSFDPGFNAYVGFMHIEMAHTNPVVIVFLRLLALDVGIRKQSKLPFKGTDIDIESAGLTRTVEKKSKRYMHARNNWQTMYTLLNNPSVRLYRKHHIDYTKTVLNRRTNKTAIGDNLDSSAVEDSERTMALELSGIKNKTRDINEIKIETVM
ncbi:hypothetical protein CHS0354_004563 [Potamilus streckersoni]|uniref:Receptor for retinol uptake STRA6 n=1 Tax=Potamilus streckersoni TaxID=2493646 RepID=A0AAE0VPC9_9BIVA|nr:hypothetical protein CHS0354_004563 [Potamilus streckersoni]